MRGAVLYGADDLSTHGLALLDEAYSSSEPDL
jgi:hypothetical protein